MKVLIVCLTLATSAQAATHLSLDESIRAALETAPGLKAARAEAEAGRQRVKAAQAQLWPRLSAEGSYRWVAEVPEVKLSPQAPAVGFGDHHNYSLGLLAQWDVFSGLSSWRYWQASQVLSQARIEEAQSQERSTLLRVQVAYFLGQLAQAKQELYAKALKLAQDQAADLELRLKAGSASRIDALAASNEALERQAQFHAAQAELNAALRELLAVCGAAQSDEVALSLDSSSQLLAAVEPQAQLAWDPWANPRLQALASQAKAARAQAEQAKAGHWFRGGLSAKESLDYPNGPVLAQVQQTTLGANLSLPLYSFGAVSAQVQEQEALAESAAERAKALNADLQRDWYKAKDRLSALKVQRGLGQQRTQQAEALQQLVLKAYKVGGSNYLEAQSASLRALQAGLDLAVTETQMLIELATMAALNGPSPQRKP